MTIVVEIEAKIEIELNRKNDSYRSSGVDRAWQGT
jgi:hypothetical protein